MCSRCRNAVTRATRRFAAIVLAGTSVAACGREVVQRQVPPGGDRMEGVRLVPLRPGMPGSADVPSENPLGRGADTVKDGRRLYQWMNCIGCHFDGGGGMGPPLMDEKWIYGSQPAQIFDSIVNGRPNGMPAYGDRLGTDEIWRIVAYVETLAEQGREQSKDGNSRGEQSGNGQ